MSRGIARKSSISEWPRWPVEKGAAAHDVEMEESGGAAKMLTATVALAGAALRLPDESADLQDLRQAGNASDHGRLPSRRERSPSAFCCNWRRGRLCSVTESPFLPKTIERPPREPARAIAARYTMDRAVALRRAHFQFQQVRACARRELRLEGIMPSWSMSCCTCIVKGRLQWGLDLNRTKMATSPLIAFTIGFHRELCTGRFPPWKCATCLRLSAYRNEGISLSV